MNRPVSFTSIAAYLLLFLFCTTLNLFGQAEARSAAEPSFEILLNVVTGSNDVSQPAELPAGFSAIAKQLKSSFGYARYKTVNTYIGRIGNNGNIEYKSLADIFGREQQLDAPGFLEWSIGGLRSMTGAGGANAFQLQSFRFGARVPIRIGSGGDTGGKPTSSVQYESVGLKVDRMSILESSPALIGTIALPRADGTVFLVLTVKPAQNE